MYDDENREKRSLFSEPDERGVRYYQSGNTQGGSAARKEKSHSLRNSLIVLAFIFIGLAALGVSCGSIMQSGEKEVKLPAHDYIATIYVEGTIARGNTDSLGVPSGYQHDWTLSEIDRLIGDGNNKGMILYVDSPGGGVYESDELYFKIKEYEDATGRPVYVSMASMAASGGYYISTPADKIFANRNCMTGSIGVTIGTIIDISGFLEKYGIKTTTIYAGKNKSMGGYFEPLTQEQRDIFQGFVDEAYDQFTGIVAEERGIDIEKVRQIADGRIYTAAQAQNLGLVDAIGTYKDAVADMKHEYGLSGCDVVDIQYVYRSWLPGIFGIVNQGERGDAATILNFVEEQKRFPVSYLCEALAE